LFYNNYVTKTEKITDDMLGISGHSYFSLGLIEELNKCPIKTNYKDKSQ